MLVIKGQGRAEKPTATESDCYSTDEAVKKKENTEEYILRKRKRVLRSPVAILSYAIRPRAENPTTAESNVYGTDEAVKS